jgi:hypothetical protein
MNKLTFAIEELEARIAPDLTMTITPSAGESGPLTVPAELPADAAAANANADGVDVG